MAPETERFLNLGRRRWVIGSGVDLLWSATQQTLDGHLFYCAVTSNHTFSVNDRKSWMPI